jgi:hypothetical protein
MATFILTTLGEWLENNAVSLAVAVFSWLTSAGALVWALSQISASSKANGEKLEDLAAAFEHHAKDFDKHKTDANVHTTFEFRQSIGGRLDRLEDEVKNGHERIESKIDRWAERIMQKQ